MWPWEHAAIGYLCYSLAVRAWGRSAPSEWAAVAVVVGTQFPDLVDKPLAWSVAVLPSGHALAHSLPVTLPLCGLAILAARRIGVADAGVAFAVGYLAHLLGDVIYPALIGGEFAIAFLPTPLLLTEPVVVGLPGVIATVATLWREFLVVLSTPRGCLYLVSEVVLLGWTVGWWAADDWPGLGPARRLCCSLDPG